MEKYEASELVSNTYIGEYYQPSCKVYKADEVDALLSDVQALVEAANIGLKELNDMLTWLGPCEHDIGKCECEFKNKIEILEKAIAAVEARMKGENNAS